MPLPSLRARRLLFACALALGCAAGPRGDDPRLRYEGRVVRADGAVRFAWPAVTLHARFTGSTFALRVHDDLFEARHPQPDALGVFVDDAPMRRVPLRPGDAEYVIAEGLPPGAHTVRVMKLTEAEAGTVTVRAVRLAPGGALLAPPPRPSRRLLVVGDSISVGYGVDGPNGDCRATMATHDAARAWPTLLAAGIGAELQLLAWSGRGVVRNFDANEPETLPVLIRRAIPTDPRTRADDRGWTPDDIALNVGTNDAARLGFDDARYADGLEALVAQVQSHAPRARVALVVGPMLHDAIPAVGSLSLQRVRAATDVVVARRRAAGFTRTVRVEVPAAPESEGRGCDQHPSAATQRRIADLVAAALPR